MGGSAPTGGATRARYEYVPGEVGVLAHTDGSGALLEGRIREAVEMLTECQHEARDPASPLTPSSTIARPNAMLAPPQPSPAQSFDQRSTPPYLR